ncbi:DUF3632 domain-containing protein [Aspergillus clavatus NRRL 1]|uniref:Uncharacterized protein n=1 Tax=Aspergillus clavatus (strain ATCC 1007 / CBS 513.65 / DSM 816 / NCTC 3887 / NRRL 1 / QM 1276 / 107) TaxID=344612 RepID=A1C5B4_ASPCL|nr:uncharacterized protein ACLA_002930 [Aspergillus clavatus NRRL 1]EAW14882.1 conserved hypothetical protein [Aspergillus clavatus NRRL 1]
MSLHLELKDDDPWFVEEKIFDVLKNYLQDPTVSPTIASQALDRLFPANRPDEDQPADEPREEPGSFLWHFWDVFHRVAQQIPYDRPEQERLVQLVKTLKGLSSQAKTVYLASWDQTFDLWEDLPMLGPTYRETYDRMTSFDTQTERESWQNLNAFAARLTRDDSADLSLFGKSSLEALADDDLKQESVDDVSKSNLECTAIVAAEWVLQCGQKLVDRDEDSVSPETWEKCKKRFKSIADEKSTGETACAHAERAQKAIAKLEGPRVQNSV